MEVTLLIEAMDTSFKLMEDARKQALGLLDTAVKLTSETRDIEEQNIQAIFTGSQEEQSGFQHLMMTFVMLFGFWLLLSGKYDLFHLSLGVICSSLIAYLTHDLLFANVRLGNARVIARRFFAYIPWLLYQIITSNIYVASVVLGPKHRVKPQIIRFKTKLESDISWVTLANSITLTPGTITMDIKDGEFLVHALDKKVADDLNAGEMEDRIAHVYMEADHIYVQDALDVAPIFGELKKGM
ncbi:MAG: Na+/H+ antiporter subunit E [Deltaproteobacteria bacterium]|nr:Na+/H+ antiporter subunit E [Deltaproteobacteria bacterium]